jgi:hypothetical protein
LAHPPGEYEVLALEWRGHDFDPPRDRKGRPVCVGDTLLCPTGKRLHVQRIDGLAADCGFDGARGIVVASRTLVRFADSDSDIGAEAAPVDPATEQTEPRPLFTPGDRVVIMRATSPMDVGLEFVVYKTGAASGGGFSVRSKHDPTWRHESTLALVNRGGASEAIPATAPAIVAESEQARRIRQFAAFRAAVEIVAVPGVKVIVDSLHGEQEGDALVVLQAHGRTAEHTFQMGQGSAVPWCASVLQAWDREAGERLRRGTTASAVAHSARPARATGGGGKCSALPRQ